MSIKLLGKHSLIYGVGHIMTRGITLLLLPLYTNIFSLEEYGIISLIYTFLGFMNVILHYGLDASLLKYYVPASKEERKTILTNVYVSFILTNIGFTCLMILFRDHISKFLFASNLPQITLFVSGILFFDVLWAIHVLLLRAEEKPILFTVINLFYVLASLVLNILFVLYFKLGIYGVLLSNIITSGSIFIITSPIIQKRISLSTLSIHHWIKLMKFGYPFLFAGIFSMILELSDRYILLYLTNIETVGLYNAGYKFGMLMMLVIMGFNMAWHPYFLKQNNNNTNYISKATTLILSVLGFIWVLLFLWSDSLVRIQIGETSFFGKEYWISTQIIPIIALGYIFHALYLLQLPGIYLVEKSGWIAWVRCIGAVSNIVLNFLFIPRLGIMGAAGATCISFIIVAVIFYFINQKIFSVSYNWGKLGLISCTAGLIYIIQFKFQLNFSMKIMMSLFYPAVMIITGVLKVNHVRSLVSI